MDEQASLCARVRSSCERVAAAARHVRIDRARVDVYARSLVADLAENRPTEQRRAAAGDPEATAGIVVCLDAFNFGSGYHPELLKPAGRSGSVTMSTRFTDHVQRAGPPTGAWLRGLDVAACGELFGQRPSGAPGELMGLFATGLNELGRFLGDRHADSFVDLVGSAGGSACRLAAHLADHLPQYRDVAELDGETVALYKRAQITGADLAVAFDNRGPGAFDDLDQLTIFADNLVPHVLRLDGLLDYDPDLVDRIGRGELLVSGSREEVEIRACSVHAVELIVASLAAAGRACAAVDVDQVLWRRGGGTTYKAVPRHRARSTFY